MRLRPSRLVLAIVSLALYAGAWAQGPPAPAHRVITLAPHITEMVFAAGGGAKLVATVNSSNFPPAALDLPRVGDGLSTNAEELLALNPDLVLAWQESQTSRGLAALLERLNIPLALVAPQSLDDIPDAVENLGQRLGTSAVADAAADRLRAVLRELRRTHTHKPPVRVFIEVGSGPLYTLGKDALTADVLSTCGGQNVFSDSNYVAPSVSVEAVLARKPEILIIASDRPKHLQERRYFWQTLGLEAARHGRAQGVEADLLLRPGPRLIMAARRLCRILDEARQVRPDRN